MDREWEVQRIVNNVLSGIRTKAELKACNCGLCKEALKRLKG